MTSANAKVKAAIHAYILNAIDSEGYEVTATTDKEKLQFLADTFKKEYCFPDNFRRYGTVVNVMAEWLQGLPSSFNIGFYNDKILEVAKSFGNLPEHLTEAAEDKILSGWWIFIANNTLQLMRKHGISVTYFLN